MQDYSFVTTRLATGAAISSVEEVEQLVRAGITHVIDCRDSFTDMALFARQPHISYLWNGTPDDGMPKDSIWFRTSLEFALPALSTPNRRIYAHCAAGVNRGPSTCYALLRAMGFESELAAELITRARPQVRLAYRGDADLAVASLGYV
jgi:protein-tyrosine phosphatase